MQIQNITQIRVEEFPSQKEWIGKLLLPLNQFLQQATTAINGNLTYVDNIPAQTQGLSFVFSSVADFPKKFAWNLKLTPVEMRIASAFENRVPIILLIAWQYGNGVVSITSMLKATASGNVQLTPGSTYTIILRGQP